MKKSSGTVFAILGAIASALSLFFYSKASSTFHMVPYLAVAALALCLLFAVLSKAAKGVRFFSLLVCAASVLLMAAFAFSLVTEVEVLGYLISGLRTWADVQYWAYFSIAALLGWLILLIGSFTGLGE